MLETNETTQPRTLPPPPDAAAFDWLPYDGSMEGEVRPVTAAPPGWQWVGMLLAVAFAVWAFSVPLAVPMHTELPVASVEDSLAVFEAALAGEMPAEDRRVLELAYGDLQAFAAHR